MAPIPVERGDAALLEARCAELERHNRDLALLAAEAERQRDAARDRASRATRDVGRLQLELETAMGRAQNTIGIQHAGVERLATRIEGLEAELATANARVERFAQLHTPTVSEHHVVTAIVRHTQRLQVAGLEVHVFIDGRRLI